MGKERINETIEKIIALLNKNNTSTDNSYNIGYLNCLISVLEIMVSNSREYITLEDFENYERQVSWISQERDSYCAVK